jgi:hypothetical protein
MLTSSLSNFELRVVVRDRADPNALKNSLKLTALFSYRIITGGGDHT